MFIKKYYFLYNKKLTKKINEKLLHKDNKEGLVDKGYNKEKEKVKELKEGDKEKDIEIIELLIFY